MSNQQKYQDDDSTKVTLLRNGEISSMSVIDFLEHMDYITSYGEPVWFKSKYYGQPKMFIGDMNGQPVFIGPYIAGEGIEINNNIRHKGLGKIKMRYPIPVIAGNGGKVLAVNESETNIEWVDLNIEHGTREYWNSRKGYIPKPGQLIIYDDYYVDETGLLYPGIKVGTGNAYVQDLAFVGQHEADVLDDHIRDMVRHITQEERNRWNNKLHVDDESEVIEENLILDKN